MPEQISDNAIGAENFVTANWTGWEPKVDEVNWDGECLSGSWRYVLECTDHTSGEQYVLKIAKKKPLEYLLDFKPNRFFRHLIRCDENSGERRALTRLHQHPELRNHFPEFISHGKVNGLSAIVVSKLAFHGKIKPIKSYVAEYKFDDTLRRRLEDLCVLMCERHIICNDISPGNVVVSDRSSGIYPVVIDGFGNNHLIPYPVISSRLNARKLKRRFGRMIAKLSAIEQGLNDPDSSTALP